MPQTNFEEFQELVEQFEAEMSLTCIIHSQSNQKQPRHPRHIGYSWDKAALPGFIIVGCENWVY